MAKTAHSIDLGSLQSALVAARKLHGTNSKAKEKADEAFARSKRALLAAQEALDAASKTVLNGG